LSTGIALPGLLLIERSCPPRCYGLGDRFGVNDSSHSGRHTSQAQQQSGLLHA